MREVGVEDARALVTPGIKVKVDEENDEPLSPDKSTKYKRRVARGNVLQQDRVEIQFAVKELSRDMCNPRTSSWEALTRLAKYLKGRPRMVQRFDYQPMVNTVNVFTDADWAGENSSRKSTSGGAMQLGDHVLKSWASTQSVIALSSGESEFYVIVKGASQGMGMKSLLADLNFPCHIKVLTDATTGKSIASRRGLGRVRHVDVANLWIQEKVRNGDIAVLKIKNSYNSSDIGTKHLDQQPMKMCLEQLGFEVMEGRHELAPALNAG